MGWSARAVPILAALVVILTAQAVGAQSARNEALRHFREGQKHFNLGEFDAALKEFRESYRLKDDPTLLFNIGQCQWKLGDLRTAVHSYRAYLRMGRDVPNRGEVEARIQDLEARLHAEEETGGPNQAPPSADQTVDEPRSDGPTTSGAAAEPAATAQLPDANQRPVPVPLPAPTPPQERAAVPMVDAHSHDTGRKPIYRAWWFWAAAGAAVAGGIVAAFMLGSSSSSDPACPAGVRCG